MPFALYALALVVFAQGTSEFMLSGLIPDIARDMAVSLPAAGSLTSAFALGMLVGAPAAAMLGQVWGWRAAFWAVALLSVPALAAILRSVPAGSPARRALRAPPRPPAPPPPLPDSAPNCARCAGRYAGARPDAVLLGGGTALLTGWIAFALSAGNPVAATALTLVQGTLSFAVGSTLISRVLYAASGAPSLAGGFATASLNVGAALGPWCGGLTLSAGLGCRAPLGVSALLVGVAFAEAGVVFAARRVVGRRVAERQGPAARQELAVRGGEGLVRESARASCDELQG
ncbi:hypothetical protein [Streptomyces sp. ODS28]|uniref:hypothetical protein n=1 Tax=Streptomyces sp. ODS28 TaxID=3136688 RepID=UPI0031E6F132